MEVSSAGRVIFPSDGITKGEVVAHYERVAERMLPHLLRRPLTLHRFPRGIDQKGFFQKNVGAHFPEFIERIEFPKRGGTTVYPGLRDTAGIAYLANQGALAFHIPGGRMPAIDEADRLVFDLDPPDGGLEKVRAAARATRAFLDEIGIATVLFATGSKGYHLVANVSPALAMAALSERLRQCAALLARRHPDLLSDEFRIEKRRGRVFVDWMRTRPGATCIAPIRCAREMGRRSRPRCRGTSSTGWLPTGSR